MSTPGLAAVAVRFFASGAASLILEVVWTRLLRLVFGSTTLAVSTVLVAYMLALGVLLLPTILMGATLAMLVEAMVPEQSDIARRVGLLYGLNTLGAVAGALLATFVLFPAVGVRHTNLTAALVDSAIGRHANALRAERAGSLAEAKSLLRSALDLVADYKAVEADLLRLEQSS